MNKCGGCGKFLSGGAVCTKCKNTYHKQCANISSNQVPKHWLCPGCVVPITRKDNTNTPLKEIEEQSLDLSPPKTEDCSDDQTSFLNEIRALRSDINGFRKDFVSFKEEVRDELKELRSMYQGCFNKMETMSERLDSQESRLLALESSIKETQDLQKQISYLKQELNNRDRMSLQNDIEISGVTEHKNENIMHITGLILKKIGSTVEERDIVDTRRVGPLLLDREGKQRPRPIVLRVTRRAVHEEVIRCARTRRNISTADVAVAGSPRPIYINERLTKDSRLLFSRARLLCKMHSWKFAWTREGRVLVREGDGKPAFRVRNENDFAKIFKSQITN